MTQLQKPRATLEEKYGFRIDRIPDGWDNPIVKAFTVAWYRATGYPEDTKPASTDWVAVCEKDGSDVQAIFGWRRVDFLGAIEIGDFHARPTRRGVLASYAALERIKIDADRSGNAIFTATPVWNAKMLKAIRRFFGAPEFAVTVYRPKVVNPSEHERIALDHMQKMREAVAS